MSIVSNNIKYLRKKEHLTQEHFAEKIGIKRSLVGAYEEGRADPRLNNLLKMSEVFNVSVDALISQDITALEGKSEAELGQTLKTKVLAITVDKEGNENIDLIPQKASAGYLNGYADREYMEEMPKFRLPFLPTNGSYRAFEISGDSMLPMQPGTVIIGKYIESVSDLKNDGTYIMLTSSEGVVYKRVDTTQVQNGILNLISDNKAYDPYEIRANEILEIWESAMYISKEFPDTKMNAQQLDIENLKSIVLSLQNEVIKMKGQK